MDPPKTFGKSKFTGDPEARAKLDANSALVKLANNFARTESKMGGATLKRERLFQIVPDAVGAVLFDRQPATYNFDGLQCDGGFQRFFRDRDDGGSHAVVAPNETHD